MTKGIKRMGEIGKKIEKKISRIDKKDEDLLKKRNVRREKKKDRCEWKMKKLQKREIKGEKE